MFILKQLRRKKNLNQTDLANAVGVSLRTIQLYEKKGANIPIKNLTKIAQYFDLTIADLYTHEVNETDLQYHILNGSKEESQHITTIGKGKYIISAPLISKETQKQYALSYTDQDYIKRLPQISFVVDEVTNSPYRAFEITNDTMDNGIRDGIPNKTIVLGKLISTKELNMQTVDPQTAWVFLYKESILCKCFIAWNEKHKTIRCHSLNPSPEYADFDIEIQQIKQLFVIVKKQM